ncbi:hypothetical protein B0J14DRAFT_496375, partial [Halenospora varia]
ASGVGQENAFAFAEVGAAGIVFAGIDEHKAKEAAETCKTFAPNLEYRAIGLRLDVTNNDQVHEAVDERVKEFRRIDYYVNSAGIDIAKYFVPFGESDIEDYGEVMKVNSRGSFLVIGAVIKQMLSQDERTITSSREGSRSIGRGCIVNVASALPLGAVPNKPAYVASKSAPLSITRAVPMKGGTQGIRVNCVCPAWVQIPMFTEKSARISPIGDIIRKHVSLGRLAQKTEVASFIAFLCSTGASYINGHALTIDAGLPIGPVLG